MTTAVSSRLCFLAQVLQFRHEHGAPLHLCQRSRTGGQFVMQPEGSALDGGGKYSSCTSVQLSAPGSAQSTKDRRSSSKSSPTENPGNHLQRTEGGLRRRVADEWEAGPLGRPSLVHGSNSTNVHRRGEAIVFIYSGRGRGFPHRECGSHSSSSIILSSGANLSRSQN